MRGPAELEIVGIGNLGAAGEGEITFLADDRHVPVLASSRAAAIMLKADMVVHTERPVVVCADPYLAYAKVSQLFDRAPPAEPGIHPSAVVHPDAHVAASASVGANAVVERGASLGEGAAVGPGSVVGERSVVGNHSRLFANVTLYHDVTLGQYCTIHGGAVIGADGFGFAPNRGRWERIAQNGGVVLGDWVSVGANTTIDRGAIGDTVVEEGVIIDNLCQIAHNVRIGKYTGIAATAGIAGSATIGAHCTLAGRAGIAGHVEIADGVHIGGAAVIGKSIREAGSWSSGTPMMPTGKWRRAAVRFSQLDTLAKRVDELEKKLGDKP